MPTDSDSPARPSGATLPYMSRTIALVGLMGAGKSTVGRRLAERLDRDFYDSDVEIEKAAGLSVSDIFALHGETEFRRGEQRVLARLLDQPPHVLATGGGAYLNDETRALMREKAVTVWLNADLETLWRRVQRRVQLLEQGKLGLPRESPFGDRRVWKNARPLFQVGSKPRMERPVAIDWSAIILLSCRSATKTCSLRLLNVASPQPCAPLDMLTRTNKNWVFFRF